MTLDRSEDGPDADSLPGPLSRTTDAVIAWWLTRALTPAVRETLTSGPVRRALELALSTAVLGYATTDLRLALSGPLIGADSLLPHPEVSQMIAAIVTGDPPPDAVPLATLWRAAVPDAPAGRDFSADARTLLGYIQGALLNTEVFSAAINAHDLGLVAPPTPEAPDPFDGAGGGGGDNWADGGTSEFGAARARLDNVRRLFRAGFSGRPELMGAPAVRWHIHDFSGHIADWTNGFVGRAPVLDGIKRFIDRSPRGYYVVRAHAGIGKTAIMASLVRERNYIHHFNIFNGGPRSPELFLRNVRAQLVARHGLESAEDLVTAADDGRILYDLTDRIVRARPGTKVVVVVDAIDESDRQGVPDGTNSLFLPPKLPVGVYFVLAVRDEPDDDRRVVLRFDCEQDGRTIKANEKDNRNDILEYLRGVVRRPKVQQYIQDHAHGSEEWFLSHLAERSEWNFMYLRQVVPQIEDGIYRSDKPDNLPSGLVQYYSTHLNRMLAGEDPWDYLLPVLAVLMALEDALTANQIARFSRVSDPLKVNAALRRWNPFLTVEPRSYLGRPRRAYRLYHKSFQDFLLSARIVSEDDLDRIRDEIDGDELGGS